MKIQFRLAWAKGDIARKHFKSEAAYDLFAEYLKRIGHFGPTSAIGFSMEKEEKPQAKLWLCHSSKTKSLSSEELAQVLKWMIENGTRELQIVIGPSDGFENEDIARLKPDMLWSFGPLTLPHELAAVVATEQVYRAFTILKNLPYHSGH